MLQHVNKQASFHLNKFPIKYQLMVINMSSSPEYFVNMLRANECVSGIIASPPANSSSDRDHYKEFFSQIHFVVERGRKLLNRRNYYVVFNCEASASANLRLE